jgi:hypothetical protein
MHDEYRLVSRLHALERGGMTQGLPSCAGYCNNMQQSSTCQVAAHGIGQEARHLLRNRNVHCRV